MELLTNIIMNNLKTIFFLFSLSLQLEGSMRLSPPNHQRIPSLNHQFSISSERTSTPIDFSEIQHSSKIQIKKIFFDDGKRGKGHMIHYIVTHHLLHNPWKQRDNKGRTIAHILTARGNLNLLRELKGRGLDIEAKQLVGGKEHLSTAHFAAYCGHFETWKWLKEQGISIDIKDSSGQNILFSAAFGGKHLFIKELIQKKFVHVEKSEEFDEQVLNLYDENKKKETLIFSAIRGGNFETFCYLVDELQFDIHHRAQGGISLLHSIAWSTNTAMFENVYRHYGSPYRKGGLDINAKTDGGFTPLDIADSLCKKNIGYGIDLCIEDLGGERTKKKKKQCSCWTYFCCGYLC